MVQQYLNDRELEPKKASPAKSPSAKPPSAKSPPSKASPSVKSPKTSPAKSPSTKSLAAKSSPSKASPVKSTKSSPVRTSVSKSPTAKSSPVKSSPAKSPPVKSCKTPDSVESSPKGSQPIKTGVKRKNSDDSVSSDASEAKKPKVESKTISAEPKTAKSGKTDSRISVAEKLKKISAKAEAELLEKKARADAKKAESKKKARKANEASKDSKCELQEGKDDDPENKKKKPTKKKKEEKEIPSLLSFIKPKREASLFASAMMDIMFEKPLPISPKKEPRSTPRSSETSPMKTPPNQPEDSIPVNAKKKLTFDSAKTKCSKPKKTTTDNNKKGLAKSSSDAKKPKKKKAGEDKGKALKGKVVKRKCKKRMASLNARALIVAERESLQMVLERAARTDRYCVSWTRHNPTSAPPRSPHRTARWVDGLGNCGVCCNNNPPAKKDIEGGVGVGGGVTEVATTAPPSHPVVSPESKMGVNLLPPVLHDKEHVLGEERPSSVVDVVTAHTPHHDVSPPPPHPTPILSVMTSPHSGGGGMKKAQVLNGNLGNFGGLFGHSAPCVGACPGYSYSRTEGYVTTSASYQSFTLSGMGALNPVPLMAAPMAPTFRPSAFTVPGYNVNMPYGYFPTAPYYQPAPTPLLPQPLAEPCMLPHHMAIKVPHAQVKVLIHNPDPPQDLAAFSQHRTASSGKGGGDAMDSLHLSAKVTNDNNNNRGSSIPPHHSVAKADASLAIPPHVSTAAAASKKRPPQDKATDKPSSGSKVEASSKKKDSSACEGKRKESENKRKDSSDSRKSDNGKKREGGESNKKKDGDGNKTVKNGDKAVKNGDKAVKNGEKSVKNGEKSVKNGEKSVKNGENIKKSKEGDKGSNKKDGGDSSKKNGGSNLQKAKDSKDAKEGTKVAKKKTEKKKKAGAEKVEGGTEGKTADNKEESIPDHGWVWVGEPETQKVVSVHWDQPSEERQCYKAIRHTTHGDIVNVRDCVLLRSGSCKSDVPYVAKVGAFWEHPKSKDMMMSLLWYYQPEHTEAGRQPHNMDNEVFASRHRDENSVACIDDKCFVLTFDQYCRYQAETRRSEYHAIPRNHIVPELDRSNPDVSLPPQRELPNEEVDPDNIFCCRKVYDFRMKRVLKNPM